MLGIFSPVHIICYAFVVVLLTPLTLQDLASVDRFATGIEKDPDLKLIGAAISGYSKYEDPILGISIQYPQGYEISQSPNALLFSSQPSPSGISPLEVGVEAKDLPPGVDTAEKLMQEEMNKKRALNPTIIELGQATVGDDYMAYKAHYNYPGVGESYDLFTVKDKKGYSLSFSIFGTDKFPEFLPVIQRMSESFRILR